MQRTKPESSTIRPPGVFIGIYSTSKLGSGAGTESPGIIMERLFMLYVNGEYEIALV